LSRKSILPSLELLHQRFNLYFGIPVQHLFKKFIEFSMIEDWLAKSPRPLLYTALLASAVTATGLLSLQMLWRLQRIKEIKDEFEIDWEKENENRDYHNEEHESIIQEQLSRNVAFLGHEGVQKVRKSFVIVVGLGGVGSHAAHMLARAGVEQIRFIDFDQVTLSSLNRHAVATRSDVGVPKVIAMKNHLLKTVPHCHIDARVQMFKLENAEELLGGNPDFVLDCIDHLKTKAELINYCVSNSIRIISSMGAGAKADPSRIQIADISETFEDPLARSTRQELKRNGCTGPVPVVFSTEKPSSIKLLPLEESKVEEADQYSSLPTFRSRILPVLGTIPALFGNAMASYVLTELAEFPTEPLPVKVTKRQYDKFSQELLTKETKIQGKEYINLM
jgi:tRNA threonylcarbamoyladenosine dehydratase